MVERTGVGSATRYTLDSFVRNTDKAQSTCVTRNGVGEGGFHIFRTHAS